MKNKFRYIIGTLTVSVLLSGTSCNVLDIMQDNMLSSSNMWRTETQVVQSTYGIYQRMRSNFVQSEINVLFWGELRVGLYMWGPSSLYSAWVGKDVLENTLTATSTSASWSVLYTAIDQANLVLKYAPSESVNMSDSTREWALGQAYFARAYLYFWAARLWGDVPLNLNPIESVDQEETYPSRTPKAEVYAQIESDIDEAYARADYLGSDKYYATKTAVLMLRAEYALWMYSNQGGGSSFLTMAEEALSEIGISSSIIASDYDDIFDRKPSDNSKNKNSSEVVFALLNDQSESLTGGFSTYFAFPSSAVASAYQSNPVPIVATQWLTFQDDFIEVLRDSRDNCGDTRVDAILGDGAYGVSGGPLTWCRKFIGDMGLGNMVADADLPYYRTGLAVMMDAELKYYQGNYSAALESLNIIAERAYGVSDYYTDASQEAVLEALVHEYFLEFPAEGVIWWALIRLDKIWDYNGDLAKRKNDTNILLWPITRTAMNRNSNLTQTEGWY